MIKKFSSTDEPGTDKEIKLNPNALRFKVGRRTMLINILFKKTNAGRVSKQLKVISLKWYECTKLTERSEKCTQHWIQYRGSIIKCK